MNVAEAVRKLKTASAHRFDHLSAAERELYHKESFAVGYSLGVIDHVKWQREHVTAAAHAILKTTEAESDGA